MNNPPTAQREMSYRTAVNVTQNDGDCDIVVFSSRELLNYVNLHGRSYFRLCVVMGR